MPKTTDKPKFLLVSLDGLRPDLIGPELTPNLHALARDGLHFANHRAVYPTETYPNVASLITGAAPATHGIVANEFLVPEVDPRRTWLGSDIDRVERWNDIHGGRFHSVPTIGDILGAAGMTMWAIGTETAGSSRLLHPTVDRYPGHLCLVIKAFERSRPAGIAETVADLAGPLPPRLPADINLADQTYATDAFLALERQRGMPELAVVWYGGTDHSLHVHGLGAEETRRMIRHVDGELGRLLDWWHGHPEQDRLQIMVVSDHGHVTQTRKIATKSILADAGFKVASSLEDGAEVAHNSRYGWSGNIRVRGGDATLLTDVAHALMEHPAIGMIFTKGRDEVNGRIDGTFAQSLAGTAHERAADLDYCLRDDDQLDPFGLVGTCWADNHQRLYASNHGGFHAKVMEAILVVAGSAFRQGSRISTPSGIADIAPTILDLLGLPSVSSTGRVLSEGWSHCLSAPPVETIRWHARHGGYEQELLAQRAYGALYLHSGRRLG